LGNGRCGGLHLFQEEEKAALWIFPTKTVYDLPQFFLHPSEGLRLDVGYIASKEDLRRDFKGKIVFFDVLTLTQQIFHLLVI